MYATTDRLALPFIDAGQAQKEVTHNEALLLLDLLVQPAVVAVGRNDPPAELVAGQCWIVGAAPTGAWATRPNALATWTTAGWRYAAPRTGMSVWCEADGVQASFDGSIWRRGVIAARQVVVAGEQVVGPRQPAIADPVGGTTIDTDVRRAVVAMLDAMRSHGLIG